MTSASNKMIVNFVLFSEPGEKWASIFEKSAVNLFSKYNIDVGTKIVLKNSCEINALSAFSENSDWVALVSKEIKVFPKVLGPELIQLHGMSEISLVYFDSIIRGSNNSLFTGERPDFSPELLRSYNFLGPLVFIRSSLFTKLLMKAPPLNASALILWILLAATREQEKFQHVVEACYSENSNDNVIDAEQSDELLGVVTDHLERTGGGIIRGILPSGVIQSSRKVEGTPLVSIVIPTRGVFTASGGNQVCLVIEAVRSIVTQSEYRNFELIIVVDAVAELKVLDQLAEIAEEKLKIVKWDRPFNFSQKMNFGVLHAEGDFVLLLNDDVKVINPDWLSSMLALAQLPNAGMVGAMLYYDDDTIQHAGHAYYQGSPTHIGLGLERGSQGHNQSFMVERETSGVTAACALMPTSVFLEVGGFSPLLPGNFNDVDLCLKTGWKGYDIYWTPFSELYHFESKSRDAHVHYYELDVIEGRWGLRLNDQRYWRGHPWRKK